MTTTTRPVQMILFWSVCWCADVFAAPPEAMELDRFGGLSSLRAASTGWFRVERIVDRWFFVTPDGSGFFSLGVTHAVDCIRLDERDQFRKKFGGDAGKLSEFILERFREWGYNSSGYGALDAMQSRIPYVAGIWTEGPRSFAAHANSPNTDIFDPAVRKRLRETVRRTAARHARNPFCLGYVFIDLPVWSPVPTSGASYVDFFRAQSPEAPGRRAYVSFLRARYATDSTALAQNYGAGPAELAAADFSRIAAKSNVVADDDEAFLNRTAESYYACVVEALRAVDPHHLILGDRLMAFPERTPDSILITAAKFVDVISFQPLGTGKPIGAYLNHVARITGKPVLLVDVNTMAMRPAKDMTDSTDYEQSSGQHTLSYYLDAASSTACIGIHRCTIRDYQPWNTQYHRRGLLRADDSPYTLLIDYTRRTNADVMNLVYGKGR